MDGRIKFRHLAAFVEIVQRASLKRAATALNLTQPAISKTLRDLEQILGATLMTRDRGGVTLTPEGAVFLQFARTSLSALKQGVAGVDQLARGAGGRLRIGALPSVAARVMPLASRRFEAIAPDCVLSLEDGPHAYLVDRLRSGILDLVIGRLGAPDSMAGLSFTQLYSEHVVFVTRPGHPLGDGRAIRLADWPVIWPPAGAAIRPLVDRLIVAMGQDGPGARIETVSGAFGRELTLQGDAIWVISQGVVQGDLQAGRLVRLAVDTALTAGPVGIMARAEEDTAPLARLFRQAVLEAVDDLGLSATHPASPQPGATGRKKP